MRALTQRTRTRIGVACLLVVLGFIAIWFIGQSAGSDPTLRVPSAAERIYPGTWPPAARGILWLFAGGAAVGFDLLVMRPLAETPRGRRSATVAAVVTGACFLAFAVGTFVEADWSVIH